MSTFEKLFSIADDEVLEKLRQILTKEQIALALACMLAKEAGLTINQVSACKATGESRTTFQSKLRRIQDILKAGQ
jgi:hypothetical protein